MAPIFLVGATGAGKSAAALELARGLGGARAAAILCMDAMQVYRGADIGTSKPSMAEREEIPHGGLDLADLGEQFDVAQYVAHAAEFLREQAAAGRHVIIVGGTGLYFHALTRGLCEAPQGSDELRAELAAMSTEDLRARLARVDAAMLERIDAANPRRLARAIEVMEETGRSLRAWQEETPEPLVREFSAFWIQRGKEELHARIEARVEEMFAQGWVEEVRELMARHGVEAVRGFAGIGYGEIANRIASCALRAPGQQVARATEGGATELREQVRSQVQLGNEGSKIASCAPGATEGGTVARRSTATTEGSSAASAGQRPAATMEAELKGDISVATRQYAKRQLTWFARENKLTAVMVTGNQSFSSALRAAALPALF